MEQPQYLIDTNAVIDYLGRKMSPSAMVFMDLVIDAVPHLSVVSKIEVLSFNAPEEHYELLTDFMADAVIYDLSENVIDQTIQLRKHHKTKLPDAIIAATALVYDLTLISRNIADFRYITGLKLIDAHLL
ncbi:hypothetical protein A0256_21075 [Mucilaginibacter sp. PAMC 26640]|nr:hypothetical protein A0256_21075 [Mucilaginibacter sp. PAMC 26640]